MPQRRLAISGGHTRARRGGRSWPSRTTRLRSRPPAPRLRNYSRMPPEMSFRFSNNPAYWRDRAAEACTMASTADAEAKAILLRLANDFVRLADRAEARLK